MKLKTLFKDGEQVGTYTHVFFSHPRDYNGPLGWLKREEMPILALTTAYWCNDLQMVILDQTAFTRDDFEPFDLPERQRTLHAAPNRVQALRLALQRADAWKETVREAIPPERTEEEAWAAYRAKEAEQPY
jgi:hypothetical protein